MSSSLRRFFELLTISASWVSFYSIWVFRVSICSVSSYLALSTSDLLIVRRVSFSALNSASISEILSVLAWRSILNYSISASLIVIWEASFERSSFAWVMALSLSPIYFARSDFEAVRAASLAESYLLKSAYALARAVSLTTNYLSFSPICLACSWTSSFNLVISLFFSSVSLVDFSNSVLILASKAAFASVSCFTWSRFV